MINTSTSGRFGDVYLVLLAGLLLGYAMMGKGFAYLGLPPLYIGEMALLLGILAFWRTGCLFSVLTTLPALLLAATMAWVLLQTLPFISDYGVDALRDSIVVTYGGFCFIVMALLIQDSRRLNTIIHYYQIFLNIYVPAAPFLFVVSWYMGSLLPNTPGTSVPFLQLDPGALAVHATGAAVFALVGFRKVTVPWLLFLLASAILAAVLSRGAMLAEVLSITAAVLLLGKWRQLLLTAMAGVIMFATAYLVEPVFFDYTEATASTERAISTRQVANNVVSIIGQGDEQGEGTKEWRKEFWNSIIADTVFGSYFWTGRGFGVNLADVYGFRDEHDAPALRAPHSVLMTMLGRAGVPGVMLWLGIVVSWLGMMMHALWTARRHGQAEWAGLFIFVSCYTSSILINAAFDPALEGPMQGIWFWSLIGFGIAAVMIYRRKNFASSDATDTPVMYRLRFLGHPTQRRQQFEASSAEIGLA